MRPPSHIERWEIYMMWAVSLAIELTNMGANFISAHRAKKALGRAKNGRRGKKVRAPARPKSY